MPPMPAGRPSAGCLLAAAARRPDDDGCAAALDAFAEPKDAYDELIHDMVVGDTRSAYATDRLFTGYRAIFSRRRCDASNIISTPLIDAACARRAMRAFTLTLAGGGAAAPSRRR